MKLTLYIDEEGKEAVKSIPRTVSISKIMKWICIAIVTSEKDLQRIKRTNPEAKEVAEYLKEKLGAFLG